MSLNLCMEFLQLNAKPDCRVKKAKNESILPVKV
jgi:hypothetical protein